MKSIQVAIDARNPGEYLAVCGLVELVGRIDRAATSEWTRRVGMVPEVPTAATDICEIDTHLDEPQFAQEVATAIGARGSWKAITELGRVPLEDAIGLWTAGIELGLPRQGDVVIDHWYERAFVSGGKIVQKDGKRDGNGEWKFWAGQQDKNKGIAGLVLDLVDGASKMPGVRQTKDLLRHRVNGRSPLKLDAVTARSSIDRGISANDAEKVGAAFVRPGLELLAAIGISTFFPPRRHGNAAPEGTIGIYGRVFRYSVWKRPLPLTIARVVARGAIGIASESKVYESPIGGKEYGNLRFARPAGVAGTATMSNDTTEEETDDE
jgi:CRISPR-associated protein Csb3